MSYEVYPVYPTIYFIETAMTLSDSENTLISSVTPQDLEDEELQAYAEEYATLADFNDVVDDDWSLSDLEDFGPDLQRSNMCTLSSTGTADVDMEMS
jgi:hypothetical protein